MTRRGEPNDDRGNRSRLVRRIRRVAAPSIRASHVLFAIKAAIAVGLAWPAAQLLPGTIDEYSYYAPLGALISMTPTLMGSLRSSLQTALGIALGIGLAWGVLVIPIPAVISVPLAVGIGAIVGGLRGLGPGGSYVPVAALFVLVVGGSQADDFTVGYVLQVAVGIVIGLAVNLIIVPPLHQRESAAEITALRGAVATRLKNFAEALSASWPPQNLDVFVKTKSLDSAVRAAVPIIDDARESRRINPRKRWNRYDMQEDLDDLNALSWLSVHTRDIGEALSSAASPDFTPGDLSTEVKRLLSETLTSAAGLIGAWDERTGEVQAAEDADEALSALAKQYGRQQPDEIVGTVIFDLRRILAIVKSRRRSESGN